MLRKLLLILLLTNGFLESAHAASRVNAIIDWCFGRTSTAQLKVFRGALEGILSESAPKDSLSSVKGNCAPCSVRLYRAMNRKLPGHWRIVDGNLREATLRVDGQPKKVNARHTFLVGTRYQGSSGEIILDPTYLQFIRKDIEIKESPIFLGTRKELIAFFIRYRNQIDPRFADKNVVGQIDPEEFVKLHYGFGRSDIERLDETEKMLEEYP